MIVVMRNGDRSAMGLALRLARRGLGQTSPNPSVGAVLVGAGDTKEIVGRGWTQTGGRPHAERVALDQAGSRAEGATLYVTLEPCAHHGLTPPCSDAIAEAGVARVVYAMEDPDPRVRGKGLEALKSAGVEVDNFSDLEDVQWPCRGHALRQTRARPFVQLKLALGADGRLAPGDGAPVWVTGETARARGHLLRAQADAILVGRNTVAVDDPSLTCRLPGLGRRSPIRVVLDTNLKLPVTASIVTTAKETRTILVCSEEGAKARGKEFAETGAEIIAARTDAGGVDLSHAFMLLAEKGVTRILVEGGPNIAKSCLAAGVIDEAVIFAGDKPAGETGLLPFVDAGLERVTDSEQFVLYHERMLGPDRMAVYRLRTK